MIWWSFLNVFVKLQGIIMCHGGFLCHIYNNQIVQRDIDVETVSFHHGIITNSLPQNQYQHHPQVYQRQNLSYECMKSCIQGQIGPFRANNEAHIPLWLALQLKKEEKCQLVPPNWFQQNRLNKFQEFQKQNQSELINLQHSEFFEISYIFLSKAPEDVAIFGKVSLFRALIQGLQNMRREKIRRLLQESKGPIKLINLTTYEANRIREPLSKLQMMVDRLKKLQK